MKITRRGLAGLISGFGSAVAGTRESMRPEEIERRAKIERASKLTGIPAGRVKITGWHPDTCGCKLEYIWDYATVDNPDERVHHPFSAECCPVHACHTTPAAALEAVWKENRAKNVAVGLAAQAISIEATGIRWSFLTDRKLRIEVPDEHKHRLAEVRNVVRESVEVV